MRCRPQGIAKASWDRPRSIRNLAQVASEVRWRSPSTQRTVAICYSTVDRLISSIGWAFTIGGHRRMPSLVAREVGNEITGRDEPGRWLLLLSWRYLRSSPPASAPATHQAESRADHFRRSGAADLIASRPPCLRLVEPIVLPAERDSIPISQRWPNRHAPNSPRTWRSSLQKGWPFFSSNAANIWQAELNAFYNYGPGSAQALTGSPRLTTRVTGMTGYDYMALVRVAVSVDCPQFNAYAPDVPATSSTTIAPAPTTTTPPCVRRRPQPPSQPGQVPGFSVMVSRHSLARSRTSTPRLRNPI